MKTTAKKLQAGVKLDALVADQVMGQKRIRECPLGDPDCPGKYEPMVGRWPCLPPYSTDIAAAHEMENEIECRGLAHPYSVILAMTVCDPNTGWQDWQDTWRIIRATPAQRCRAALAAISR